MQNFENLNYNPQITEFVQFPNPQTNEPFNRATQPSDKPVIGKHIFAIDSRQRDFLKYPHANEYTIPIPERYRNVTSIELKAAILPRTEYNINSSNKYIDVNIGDFISDILIEGANEIFYFNNINIKKNPPNGIYFFKIINNNINNPAKISAEVIDGKIIKFEIINSGSNFNYTNPPSLVLEGLIDGINREFTVKCIVKIGLEIPVILREGQYIIGGNPELYVRNNGTGKSNGVQNQTSDPIDTPIQSWVPFNLLDELEASITFNILEKIKHTTLNNAEYSYNRKSIFQNYFSVSDLPNYEFDYPLLFSTRLISQYPILDNSSNDSKFNYDTNSCKFNRINFSNNLLISLMTNNLSADYFKLNSSLDLVVKTESVSGLDTYTFNIIGSYLANQSDTNNQNWILSLNLENINNQRGNFQGFDIISTGEILQNPSINIPGYITNSAKICPFGLRFAAGENQIVNSASLLGFNKINYGINQNSNGLYNSSIIIQPSLNSIIVGSPTNVSNPTLQLSGLYYRTENDYCLVGDPEYVILSFRAKYGSNSSIPGINDRVESQNTSNLDRVFACLIYDSTMSSVLQEISSGSNNSPIINSAGAQQNSNCTTYLMNSTNGPNITYLGGNSGSQNTIYQKTPSNLKALKGADFDRKIIEFNQPIAQIFDMSIRFSKFTKWTQGSSEELYNFHGKEHLLLFEITCSDFLTGKRF